MAGLIEGFGDDYGDGLAAVANVGVLEKGQGAASGGLGGCPCQLEGVEGGYDGQDAGGVLGSVAIHHGYGAVGDRGLDDVCVGEILLIKGLSELRGEFGFAGDLGEGGIACLELPRAGVGLLFLNHAVAPGPCAATVRARTMPCLANSILKVLCS